MMVLSTPLRIAGGATLLSAVAVVSVLSIGAERSAVDVDVAEQVAPVSTADESVATREPKQNTAQTATATEQMVEVAPKFDLVRVDTTGSAVIAGSAAPQSEVAIMISGSVFETVKADNNGAFVALLQLPPAEAAMTVGLQQLRDGAAVGVSLQTVLVAPPPLDAPDDTVPMLVLADEGGAKVLQGGAQAVEPAAASQDSVAQSKPLSLDTISYDNSGAVVLSGQGTGAQFVRIYVDNTPIETELVPDNGTWRVVLPDVDQGVYTLRVDEIDDLGKVQARVESPFQRVAAKDLVGDAVQVTDTGRVIVQPGHTLWELAETTYGDGEQYVQIFHANRDTIRDANLIYPGQVFSLPD